MDQPLELGFAMQDFVQVNTKVNQGMVEQALNWLELQAKDQVLDLFSGVGNFALPIASMADQGVAVLALEGDYAMVKKGRLNAQANGLSQVDFEQADLFDAGARILWQKKAFSSCTRGI